MAGNGQARALPSAQDFILRAVQYGRTKGKDGQTRQGLHTVYSGLVTLFAKHYPGVDFVATVKSLTAAGKLFERPTKGGFVLYLPADVPDTMRKVEILEAAILEGKPAQA